MYGGEAMDFLIFKDLLFDLINESDKFNLEDISSIEKENRFHVVLQGGMSINIMLQQDGVIEKGANENAVDQS